MVKTVNINGRQVIFKASGATPMLYRIKFGRDVFADIGRLESAIKKNKKGLNYDNLDLQVFLNIAYLMAKQADPSVPDDQLEWLDTFEVFDINQILPEIMELWKNNSQTTIENKKKLMEVVK